MKCSSVLRVAFACGAIAMSCLPTLAQSTTTVPLADFTRPNWMASGTQTVTGGGLQVVQNSGGWGWNLSQGSSTGEVFDALKQAAVAGGTLSYVVSFDPTLLTLSGTAQPTFLQVNMFQQGFGGGSGDKWIQTFSKPSLGSSSFPLTGIVSSTISLPIVGWTNGVDPTPADNTNAFYVEKNSTFFQFGYGMNSNNLAAQGFVLSNVQITAVPEPGSITTLGIVIGGMGFLSVRRRMSSRPARRTAA